MFDLLIKKDLQKVINRDLESYLMDRIENLKKYLEHLYKEKKALEDEILELQGIKNEEIEEFLNKKHLRIEPLKQEFDESEIVPELNP